MRTARSDVDRPVVGRSVTVTLDVLAVITFAAGYGSLTEVARRAGLSQWSAWTIPATVDLGMALLGLSAMVQRSRRERAGLMWPPPAYCQHLHRGSGGALVITSTATGWVLVVARTPSAVTLAAAEVGTATRRGHPSPTNRASAAHWDP